MPHLVPKQPAKRLDARFDKKKSTIMMMMDSQQTELYKTVISEFIEAYRENAHLWDTNLPKYSDRRARNQSLKDLVVILKKIDSEANINTVRRRIDILRCGINRERHKIAKRPMYVPSLWYYEKMSFLYEGEENECQNIVCEYVEEPDCDIDDEDDDSKPTSKCEYLETDIYKDSDSEGSPPRTKKIKTETRIAKKYPPAKKQVHNETDSHEFDYFGNFVGKELSKLNHPQQSIAQKLISDVLYYARMSKLTEDSSVVVNSQMKED